MNHTPHRLPTLTPPPFQTFSNSQKLRKVQACFLEASRMFRAYHPASTPVTAADAHAAAAGFMWIRDTAEDMVLENVGPLRDERVLVPQGTRLVVDGIGLRQSCPLLCMNALT